MFIYLLFIYDICASRARFWAWPTFCDLLTSRDLTDYQDKTNYVPNESWHPKLNNEGYIASLVPMVHEIAEIKLSPQFFSIFQVANVRHKITPQKVSQWDPAVQYHFSVSQHPQKYSPGVKNFIAGARCHIKSVFWHNSVSWPPD